MSQEWLQPHYLDIKVRPDEGTACRFQELVSSGASHCHSLLSWLRNHPQTQLLDSAPGYQGMQLNEPVKGIVSAASREPTSQTGAQMLAFMCLQEERCLQQLLRRLDEADKDPEAAVRAAAELHSMEIRLASAKAAIQAWLQAQQQPALGAELPISPYQLNSTAGALRLDEALLVEEMQWDCLSFIPSHDAAARFAKV